MRLRPLLLVLFIFSAVLVFSLSAGVGGQALSGTDLVAQAARDAGTNCASLALNTTCIGHASVQRTTSSGVVSTTYTAPGDRASTNTTHKIETSPLNTATGDFGLNVMRVQAGAPASSEGVVYVAFGGTTVTNVGGAGQAVWQNISVSMNPGSALGAPNLFLVQGPKDLPVTVQINNVPVNLHSSLAVEFQSDGSVCFFVVSGFATFFPGTPQEFTAPAGFRTCGTAAALSTPALFTPGDVAALAVLPLLPENVLNYPLEIPVIVCPSGVGDANCFVVGG